LLSSAQEIVKSLLNSPVPIIVYVAPAGASAASAGTFITEAANIAAMAPGTTIGAAHPVELGGAEIKGVMAEKIENFTASFGKSIAQQRGRNEAWMEQAVRKSASISDTSALKLHVVDIVAPSVGDLLTQASGRRVKLADGRMITLRLAGAPVKTLTMHLGQSVLNRLANPNLMYLLLIMGLAGLYLEFSHPGVFLPGVLGAICLVLALVSFEVIPINFAGLLLILIGVGMMVSEVFLTSYGILGMGGVIAFVLGSLLLVNTAQTNVGIDRGMIVGTAFGFSSIVLGVGYIVLRSRRGQATTGSEGMVGEVGEVRDPIAPGSPGRIFVHGELWRAVSDAPLAPGARAQVTAVRGLEVVVRPPTAGN
jgi:membrane-bound serine protease (ClpP class)